MMQVRHLLLLLLLLFAVLGAGHAWAQMPEAILQTPIPRGEGWGGFHDMNFLINALVNLTLAAVLGAVIAYHPRHKQTADSLEEIEAAQIYILYAVIGSIIGVLVVKYGMSIGFVLFGIGALIRFRTVLRSASMTGRLIFVTLIGLSCGLNLPHVAILVTVFGFILIFVLDARLTYQLSVRALASSDVLKAAAAYRRLLVAQGCQIVSERKNPEKGRLTLIFKGSGKLDHDNLDQLVESEIEESLRRSVDLEIS